MRVKSSRDQNELWRESLDGGQHAGLHGMPPFAASRSRRQRRINDVVLDAGFARIPRPGIERRLMRGRKQEARLTLGNGLGAVAMVHVEVDDGDAIEAV